MSEGQPISDKKPVQEERRAIDDVEAKIIRDAVKALISLSSSSIEADRTIRDFYPEFQGEETIELLRSKLDFVKDIFGIEDDPISSHPDETPRDKLIGDYYSLLSVVSLPGFTGRHNQENRPHEPQRISLPKEDYIVE